MMATPMGVSAMIVMPSTLIACQYPPVEPVVAPVPTRTGIVAAIARPTSVKISRTPVMRERSL